MSTTSTHEHGSAEVKAESVDMDAKTTASCGAGYVFLHCPLQHVCTHGATRPASQARSRITVVCAEVGPSHMGALNASSLRPIFPLLLRF
jgi:hypothetical protein